MLAASQQEAFSRGILSLICLVLGQIRSSAAGRRGGGKIAYQLLHANHKSRKKKRVSTRNLPHLLRPQPCKQSSHSLFCRDLLPIP